MGPWAISANRLEVHKNDVAFIQLQAWTGLGCPFYKFSEAKTGIHNRTKTAKNKILTELWQNKKDQINSKVKL